MTRQLFLNNYNIAVLPTHYETLGIDSKSRDSEVRTAYRKLARRYHPDLNADTQAHEKMAEINVAFEVLSDPVRRMEYDSTIGITIQREREATQGERRRPEAVSLKIYRRLKIHNTPIYSAGFERDTGRLVTSAFDNEVIWWNKKFDTPDHRQKCDGGVVNDITVIGKDHVVASGATEQSLSCWVYGNEKPKSWRKNPKVWIGCTSASPNGQFLATGAVDHRAKIIDVQNGRTIHTLCGHEEAVTAVAWSKDSSLLATGSADATVRIWSSKTGKLIQELIAIRSTVTSMCFSPDGKWLAIAAVDLSIRIFNLTDYSLRKTFFGHDRPIECLEFHPESWLLASASRDGSIGLWNVNHGIGHGLVEASHQPISCLAFSHQGDYMAAGGIDKTLRIWSVTANSV